MVARNKMGRRADPIMSREPILATKLMAPPPREASLTRPQLLERMDEGLSRSLTLVSAPPGFGKTTLLGQWHSRCRARGVPVAWLTLDEADSRPERFLHYLASALDMLQPGVSDDALNLLRPTGSTSSAVLTAMINALTRDVSGDYALILDDYERVDCEPVHECVSFLLDHMPSGLHVYLATRLEPPLPLARLRAGGALIEIRSADLRFSAGETAEFLATTRELELSPEDLNTLDSQVEGWVVGLQLAAMAMQGRREGPASLAVAFSGTHRYVVDYLASEVFERLPFEVMKFLLWTSVVDRLVAPLCDAVMSAADSGQMLARLEEANLFIGATDDSRESYRYHPLFSAFLRERFEREDGVAFREAHLRAASWFEEQGEISEAVRHSLAGGDATRALNLADTSAPGLVLESEWSTLASWFSALPEDALLSRPHLALTLVRALAVTHRLEDASRLLASLEEPIARLDDREQLGRARSVGAYIAGRLGDQAGAIRLCAEALELLPEEAVPARSGVLWTLGTAREFEGDLRSAAAAYLESVEITRRVPGFAPNWSAVVDLGYAQFEQGQLHQGGRLFKQILEAGGESHPAPPIVGVAHCELGELEREWNHLDEAEGHLDQAFVLLQSWGNILALLRATRYRAKIRMARADIESAIAVVDEGLELARSRNVTLAVGNLRAARARFQVLHGDIEGAASWQRRSGLDVADDVSHISHLTELEYLAVADVLAAQRRFPEALRLLTKLERAAADAGRGRNFVQIAAQRAVALLQTGEAAEALGAAERLVLAAQHEGYVRTFVDQGPRMAELLAKLLARRLRPDSERYVTSVLGAFAEQRASVNGYSRYAIGPLSEREGEVLELISSGLSNNQIAEQIVVTEGTVKRHVHNIFRKLDVHSRTQAIARARELNLLSP